MIDVKTVRVGQYYSDGEKVLKVTGVKKVTLVELVDFEGRVLTVGAGLEKAEPLELIKLSGASRPRGNTRTRVAMAPVETVTGSPVPGPEPASGIGRTDEVKERGHKVGASGYRGVTVRRGKNGPRYDTQINRKGGCVRLGSYDKVEEAAAAVQERLGNKIEAARLRAMAGVSKTREIKKGDSKAQDQTTEEIEQLKGPFRYMCSGCGEDYDKMPVTCVKCGGSAFETIRPVPKHRVGRTN